MTDRELLEAAAKAAGFHFHGHRVGLDYINCYVSTTGDSDDWFVWSPLTDDGDALRLAVKLRIEPRQTATMASALYEADNPNGFAIMFENYGTDPYAATRRAIVRAAAEIGKAMK